MKVVNKMLILFSVLSFFLGSCNLVTNRKWNAPPVILEYYNAPGGLGTIDQSIPDMVLYANGDILIKKYESSFQYSIYKTTLSNDEMCDFLKKIENFGFFNDNAREYDEPDITDLSTTYITIRAWKNQDIDLYGLWPEEVPTNSALADTYYFLDGYDPPKSQIYLPDTIDLEIQVLDPEDKNEKVEKWIFSEINLKEIVSKGLYPDYEQIRLTGNIAKSISEFMDSDSFVFAEEDGINYLVRIVPLLPLQIKPGPTEDGWFGGTDPYSYPQTPTVEINCN